MGKRIKDDCMKQYYKEFNKEYRKEIRNKGYKNFHIGVKSEQVKVIEEDKYSIDTIDSLYQNLDKLRKNKRNRYNNDPLFRLTCNLRSLTHKAFKMNGFKKSDRTENIIGISFTEFKEYIIGQFEPWMNENNQGIYTGKYNETWQIDHIIPISSARTPEEVIKLSHYTNLRPLCSKKNLEKSNRIE